MKAALRNIGLSLLSLLGCLILAELAFRAVGPSEKLSSWKDRPSFYYLPEISRSLRGIDLEEPKDPSTFRIGVIGDSFSFAPYMQFDDAFPRRIERMLNLNRRDSPGNAAGKTKTEVVNYGVPGYSTSHEAEELQRVIKKDELDLVILQITLNDPEIKFLTPTGIQELTNKYGELDLSNSNNPFIRYSKFIRFVLTRIHNRLAQRAYRDYYVDLYKNPQAIARFEESLQKIKTTASEHNVPVVAVVFPLFGYLLNEQYPFGWIHDYLHQQLEAKDIPSLDLFETFRNGPIDRLVVLPGEDFHPNEIAHRIAAETIYSWLISLKLIPEALRARALYSSRTQIELKPELRRGGEL